MTKEDFFRTVIKLFALYAFVSNLFSLTQSISIFGYVEDPMVISYIIISWIIILTFFLFLLLHPDYFIRKLKLTRGFDDDRIDFNIDVDKLIKIVVFVFGGILFINYLPPFLIDTYKNFKLNVNGIIGLELKMKRF